MLKIIGLCSIMNTWKNILVVVVAVDRPLDHHVLRALNFEDLFQHGPFALTAYLYLNGAFLTLTIRVASMSDKSEILDFCRVLYPEGDYFEDTFDSWLAEKTMYAMWKGSKIVCVGCISVESGQGWIEGVRVHPDFGRRGYATELIKHAERLMRSEGGIRVCHHTWRN